ncbi:hypothetical protein [Nostoc piscinale]
MLDTFCLLVTTDEPKTSKIGNLKSKIGTVNHPLSVLLGITQWSQHEYS